MPAATAFASDFFVDLDRSSPVPLYSQIAGRLERAINAKELPPGSRLENEVSIGGRFGLSRATVRRAIQELVDKGLVVRRRGIGTQVVHGRVSRGVELTSLHDDLCGSGRNPSTRIIRVEAGAADGPIAEALGIPEGSPVVRVVRLRLADGVPHAVLDNTLPGELGDLASGDLVRHGLYQLMRSRGITLRVATQRIGARTATTEESRLLSLPENAAVLTMSRTAFDDTGRAVEHGRHSYAPDLASFEMTLVEK